MNEGKNNGWMDMSVMFDLLRDGNYVCINN